ncbi:predicted protein [Botrytis cinerea T4]|uniref:Uncharacterized protein n=1 Tax=Botryotinia fuckeliana (strain T4) TaxID=999810 RepID=G2XN73_BOTF4|nr:predicted protein [Botrytis cinerea T4]
MYKATDKIDEIIVRTRKKNHWVTKCTEAECRTFSPLGEVKLDGWLNPGQVRVACEITAKECPFHI